MPSPVIPESAPNFMLPAKILRICIPAAIAVAAFSPLQAHDGCDPGPAGEATTLQPLHWAGDAKGAAVYPMKNTFELQGITFTSDYDNGSIANITSGGTNIFNCTLYTESSSIGLGTRRYWFRFRISGAQGRNIRLNLSYADTPRPFISFDGGSTWRRMTSTEAPTPNGNAVFLNLGAEDTSVEVSMFEPLGMEETYDKVNAMVSASPHASIQPIGSTFLGNTMYMVTVNDTNWPDTNKQRVWMHSRAHAGEVTSTHSMLGFLRKATEESPVGQRLRQNVIFNIVPLYNVDGTWLGHTRWDAEGRDPEREFCDYYTGGTFGVAAPLHTQNLMNQVIPLMAGPNPIRVALNMHSTVGNFSDSFFFNHRAFPTRVPFPVPLSYENHQKAYISALDTVSPYFRNGDPQQSNLSTCLFIESWFFNNFTGPTGTNAVMAMTHEGHFYYSSLNGAEITGTEYQLIGEGMAEALIEFLNLPPLIEESRFDSWVIVGKGQ